MKKASLITTLACSLLLLGTAGAWAQGSGTAASAPAMSSTAQSPKAMRKANRLLSKNVQRALVKVKGLDSSNIVVSAKSGAILLGGTVPEADQIQMAVTTAQGVNGVQSVQNALRVRAIGQ
ncbi:BON domain-containing protein [Paraburkholderia sp. B3]|uniref:BON domain-containing protein n=1 Tax=Paraburkholderia sp. B3 TaxID=3134791 RepID=UPI0039828C6A